MQTSLLQGDYRPCGFYTLEHLFQAGLSYMMLKSTAQHSSLSKVFHCVHFECPEQQSSQKEENSEESGTGDTSLASQQLDPHALRAPSGSSLPSSPGSSSRSPNRQHQ
ncbi:BTB/POZ domain-containing protein 9 [Saguinus oedipus]|uniref:BTB/POZ domain-containing protein 9 n=1 Tax=Saguinus oedipus TaxID=9490 RepID=A0ABQ9VZS9_SAGOE|nr:BTB/POZ domain-containing protein 9 [Saguinus oedipus]